MMGLKAVRLHYDTLGADPRTTWRVHVAEARIFAEPSGEAPVLRTLREGEACTGDVVVLPESDTEWLELEEGGLVSLTCLHRIHPGNVLVEGVIPTGREQVNRWWGMPAGYEPADLAEIPSVYTTQRTDRRYLLRAPAVESLVEMLAAARAAGHDIRAGSTYRSWQVQKQLYDAAVGRDGLAQRYSAPPGHSEHQLGTAVDLTDAPMVHFIEPTFGETSHYRWLVSHAAAYGWRQSYTASNVAATGYICEPWHWRFHGV